MLLKLQAIGTRVMVEALRRRLGASGGLEMREPAEPTRVPDRRGYPQSWISARSASSRARAGSRLAAPGVSAHSNGNPIHHYNTSSFAERSVVPARTAIKVDPELPLTELALMGCAVMTGVGAALNTARVRPGDTVAVIGCGGVGLNVIQGARIAGAATIVAVDLVDAKLKLARELGATSSCRTAWTMPSRRWGARIRSRPRWR